MDDKKIGRINLYIHYVLNNDKIKLKSCFLKRFFEILVYTKITIDLKI